jgi:predicted porin
VIQSPPEAFFRIRARVSARALELHIMERATLKVGLPMLAVASVLVVGSRTNADEPTRDTQVLLQEVPRLTIEPNVKPEAESEPSARVAVPPTQPAPQRLPIPAPPQPVAEVKPITPQSSPPPTPEPPTLTWNGVTLYGVIDVGIAHLSHGAPPSSTYSPGLPYIVQSYSNRPITSVANNGLGQSRLGISGSEPLGTPKLKAVFKLETGFQPTSGRLADGPRSLVDNNGRAADDKITAGDSSRAGQLFQGAAYLGLASMVGTLTFGRQRSLMADQLVTYDPQLQSLAFSPIGYSGTSGGMGATENRILDQSLKYVVSLGPVHLAGLYQFGRSGYLPGGAESISVGIDVAGLSVDLLWGRVHGAVVAASLTAAQNATAPGTLAATVSDNTAYAAMLRFALSWLKLYGGYQHITFANPENPLPSGTVTIGDYVLSNVNNTAFNIHKVLEYAWTGARASVTPILDLSAAYYYFHQNSYNANGCSDNSAASCSGSYHVASFVIDYRLSSHFDVYAGVSYSRAADGMAAGFLSDHNWTSMMGVRFAF